MCSDPLCADRRLAFMQECGALGGVFGQVVRLELPIQPCSAWVAPVRKARSSRSSLTELEKSCQIIFCAKFLDVFNDIIKSLAPFPTEI